VYQEFWTRRSNPLDLHSSERQVGILKSGWLDSARHNRFFGLDINQPVIDFMAMRKTFGGRTLFDEGRMISPRKSPIRLGGSDDRRHFCQRRDLRASNWQYVCRLHFLNVSTCQDIGG
jgi:hypothetical protein